MGIKLVNDGVSGFQKAIMVKLDEAIKTKFKYLGEELVKYAKDNHNYTDQTGNLTNSIGYAVVHNNEIVYSSVDNGSGVADDSALQAAKAMAQDIYGNNCYSLIIVAGMNYAAYVEAKGYNVILPAELKAKKDFINEIAKVLTKFHSKE